MAFTTPRTWVANEVVDEAELNQQIRDNENAIWVGDTAGDMDYYASSTTKSKIAIGATATQLTVVGGVPVWRQNFVEAGAYRLGTGFSGGAVNTGTYNQSFPTFNAGIPSTARAIIINVVAKWATAGDGVYVSVVNKDRVANGGMGITVNAQVADIRNANSGIVFCAADGTFDVTVAGANTTLLKIEILGWIL